MKNSFEKITGENLDEITLLADGTYSLPHILSLMSRLGYVFKIWSDRDDSFSFEQATFNKMIHDPNVNGVFLFETKNNQNHAVALEGANIWDDGLLWPREVYLDQLINRLISIHYFIQVIK